MNRKYLVADLLETETDFVFEFGSTKKVRFAVSKGFVSTNKENSDLIVWILKEDKKIAENNNKAVLELMEHICNADYDENRFCVIAVDGEGNRYTRLVQLNVCSIYSRKYLYDNNGRLN